MFSLFKYALSGIHLRSWRNIPLILMFASVSACSTFGVEPWERGLLSESDMQFTVTDLSNNMNRQFYSSKEASHGGAAFAGGGCGCN